VALNNAVLSVGLNFTSSVGAVYTLINNDGRADAVTGTFAGMPEGSSLQWWVRRSSASATRAAMATTSR
jgi:hypothetical protein